jgi:DNA-binding SARP family transcriptional activator
LRFGGTAVALPVKSQALLIYLAMTGTRARREVLADMFWGDTGEDGARANLRLALTRIRQAMPGVLDTDAETVGLASAAVVRVDALQLLQTVDTLREQPAEALEAAIALYRGPFLQDFTLRDCESFEDWVTAQRQRIGRRAVVLLRELVRMATRDGSAAHERRYLGLWARIEPWDENVQLLLIRWLAQDGLTAQALDSYEACRMALAEELGARPSQALSQLAEQVRRGEVGPQSQPAPSGGDGSVGIPSQPAALQVDEAVALYGRDADLRQVSEQMGKGERLVMLVGPAGVGKSRLARTIAQREAARYPDGQVACSFDFLDSGLSDEASHDQFTGALGSALGLDLSQTAQPMDMLKTHLANRRAVVCLDGFEACEGAALAVVEVLAAAPHCLILVTSRTRLAITAGWTHEVRGLGTDAGTDGLAVEPADQRGPAIDLLLDCAHRAGVGLAEKHDHLQLTRLVQLLDGSPLAIQFAAQALRLLTPSQLVAKLEQGDWPGSSLHVAGYRHSTLQDVMSDVWGQLAPPLQVAWARCALFKGSFFLDWARKSAGVTEAEIVLLVNRSILGLEPGRRLRMHELTRQYGLTMMDGMPGAGEYRSIFVREVLACLVDMLPALVREDPAVVDVVKPEIHTLAAAFDMALQRETPESIHAPLTALWRAYHRLGWHHAAVRMLDAVLLRHAHADLAWRIPWHYMAGEATRSQFGYQRAGAHFKTAATLGGVRLPRGRLQSWLVLGRVCVKAVVARPLALEQQRNTQRVLTTPSPRCCHRAT